MGLGADSRRSRINIQEKPVNLLRKGHRTIVAAQSFQQIFLQVFLPKAEGIKSIGKEQLNQIIFIQFWESFRQQVVQNLVESRSAHFGSLLETEFK